MKVKSITFDTAGNRIVVAYVDGQESVYSDAESYLADFPERESDIIAMGWV